MTLEQQFKEAKRTIPAGYKIVGWGNDKSLDYHGSDYAWDINNGWEMAGSLGAEGICSDWIYAKPAIHQQTDAECKAKAKKFFADTILKDTNPKDAIGTKKVPLSGIPAPVLLECGLVKLHGDLKYGRYNWRDAGVRHSVYYDALMRHVMAWWEGEDVDPDSGVHHLAHAITGLSVLRDSQIIGNDVDDRPAPSKDGWISELNEVAKTMIEKKSQRNITLSLEK